MAGSTKRRRGAGYRVRRLVFSTSRTVLAPPHRLLMHVLPDGILNLEFAKALSQGSGSIHGIDSSAAMIDAAEKLCKDFPNATFEG